MNWNMKVRLTITYCGLAICLAGFLPGLAVAQSANPEKVKIGVLAFRGPEAALKRWAMTAQYLGQSIEGYNFEMVPLSLADMKKTVANDELDFVLTNTGNYVDLEARYGITRIVTLRTPSTVLAGNVFGAVIFSRADRQDIQTLEDLKGKSFMAVERNGFGGFQMAWRELKEHGIDPFEDFSALTFTGFPQGQSVEAVLEGRVDAATFRTNTLELLQAEGKINMQDFRILNTREYPGFPFAVSTRLYPEWPFSRMKGTPQELAQKVAIALLSMPAKSPAALKGRYGGWTVPLDYQPVHELFRELRIGPYEDIGRITLTDILKQHGHWIVLVAALLVITVVWATWIEVLVTRRTKELSDTNLELERQISERIRAEEEAHHRRAELAHIDRLNTMGEMASGFAHELNQPLAAIVNYARGCIRRIQKQQCDSDMILDTLNQVTEQATRAGEVIKRIRAFVRKDEPERTRADINHVINESLAFMKGDAERQNIKIELDLQPNLPAVIIDHIQVEQVILNLIRNAFEAMSETPATAHGLNIRTGVSGEGKICVTVIDTGPGLLQNEESMFDPFVTSKANGLGLGLSISRSIVEAHGGDLYVTHDHGPGAALTFTLPIAETPDMPEGEA
ncbi:MAG: PhnD/SsuA/transferrin family substrate-binding protein [Rhodospirillales bacterium]|nr:PhnD/SsuA/transferrin family substrate-binding protein [Rhodospirillales bacterium]